MDNAGNRSSRTPLPGSTATNYTYDAIYELLTAKVGTTTNESYTYDAVGNRLSSLGLSPYTNNASNELTSTPSATYTYDYNGNTLTKVVGSNTTSYAWDFENRLTTVTLPGSGGTFSFKYDPFGRRIYKSGTAGTSLYAYDGENLIEETNGSGGVVARYSQGQSIDEPLAMLSSSTISYYQADGLDSVTSLTSTAGAGAQTYSYDSFGNIVATTGSLINAFRYTGREFDTETSLYYYRARYYDSQTGRFLSEDPIGFGGGGNFYRYVYNSPAGLVDPMGLSAADVQRIQKACKKCTKGLTDSGLRMNGGSGDTAMGFIGALTAGGINDLRSGFSTQKKQSCYSQAIMTKPCLEDPKPSYDDKSWRFDVVPIWLGSHRVVRASDFDPGDPIIICDPWLNRTYTIPKPPPGPSGGGSAF